MQIGIPNEIKPFEASEPITNDDPTKIIEGVIQYAVTNMPGAVPTTSILAYIPLDKAL